VLVQDKGVKFDTKESRDSFLKDFDEAFSGNIGAHRTGLLPPGITFEPVSISTQNAQWIESRKLGSREIFGIMGVPPHKGGDLADATFSNVENENLAFVIDSITPITVGLEQAITRDLLNWDTTLYTRINLSALLRGDFKSRQEGLNIQRRAGVINANEWRDLEDLNPRTDEGGEEYIVEQNMREQNGKIPKT
jgi:HK97 family phage portal protein